MVQQGIVKTYCDFAALTTKSPCFWEIAPIQRRFCKTELCDFQGAFDGLDIDADEEVEISRMIEDYKSKGGKIQGEAQNAQQIFGAELLAFEAHRGVVPLEHILRCPFPPPPAFRIAHE